MKLRGEMEIRVKMADWVSEGDVYQGGGQVVNEQLSYSGHSGSYEHEFNHN